VAVPSLELSDLVALLERRSGLEGAGYPSIKVYNVHEKGLLPMKLLMLTVAIASQIFTFAPRALCQDNTQPEPVHLLRPIPGSPGARVALTASSADRDLSTRTSESIIHLKGNVEARMINCVFPSRQSGAVVCGYSTVVHADEVDYNEKTGEIEPHGNVRVTLAPHATESAPLRPK
jgi:lipopolysaccharide assembly outer membrane protein LptD (OstA)